MASSDAIVARLRAKGGGLAPQVLRVPSWKVLRAVAPEADACVLALTAEPGERLELFRLSAVCPTCSMVLVPDVDRTGHGWEGRYPANAEVVSWKSNLISRVALARFEGWSRRLCEEIRAAEHLPYVVRLALMEIVKSGDGRRYTVTELGEQIGVDRSHLSRISRRSGVPIREVVDAWCVAQSVALRWYEGLPWSKVAWRCGYTSLSGLSDLFLRSTGLRIRGLAEVGPELCLRWFERDKLCPLLEPYEAA